MTAILTVATMTVLVLFVGIAIILEGKDKKFGIKIIKSILTFDCIYFMLVMLIVLL